MCWVLPSFAKTNISQFKSHYELTSDIIRERNYVTFFSDVLFSWQPDFV